MVLETQDMHTTKIVLKLERKPLDRVEISLSNFHLGKRLDSYKECIQPVTYIHALEKFLLRNVISKIS